VSFLREQQRLAWGPGSTTEEHESRLERQHAQFTLLSLDDFFNGVTVSADAKTNGSIFRLRTRKIWSADEKQAAVEGMLPKDADAANQRITEMVAQMEARAIDPQRIKHAADQNAWLDQLSHTHGEILSGGATQACTEQNMANVQVKLSKEEVNSMALALKQVPTNAAPPDQTAPVPPQPPLPDAVLPAPPADELDQLEFRVVSEEVYEQMLIKWKTQKDTADVAGVEPPDPPLNPEQRAFCRSVLPALLAMRDGRRGQRKRSVYSKAVRQEHTVHHLLHGAAGTGKSLMLRALDRVMQRLDVGGMAYTAYTGVAAKELPNDAPTICTLATIPRNAPTDHVELKDLTKKEEVRFEQFVGSSDRLICIVIDEISFLSTEVLHHLSRRLQQLLGCELPFGGLVVILGGDFHQLPAIGSPLHRALVHTDVDASALQTLEVRNNKPKRHPPGSAHTKGVNLFRSFKLTELTRQMRVEDREHADDLQAMRQVDSAQPIPESFLNSLQPLTAADVKADETWRFAPIAVLSNLERHAINLAQARAFAASKGHILIKWKKPMVGAAALLLPQPDQDGFYEHEEAGLWGYFVCGAPCTITSNLGVSFGIANGTSGKMHSLTTRDGSDMSDQIKGALAPEVRDGAGDLTATVDQCGARREQAAAQATTEHQRHVALN
jgi:hypothetical protein